MHLIISLDMRLSVGGGGHGRVPIIFQMTVDEKLQNLPTSRSAANEMICKAPKLIQERVGSAVLREAVISLSHHQGCFPVTSTSFCRIKQCLLPFARFLASFSVM